MIVNFRQGIVSYPVGFLAKVGTPVGSRVGLNITPDRPLILHFSHRDTNYVVVQKTSLGVSPGVGVFGPHIAGEDYWLYAELDIDTGVLGWGATTLEPVNQATTPSPTQTIISDASPTELVVQAGRHWFKTAPVGGADDITYPPFTMFVRNLANTAWEEVVRVMLAKYEESSFFVSVSVNAASPNANVKFSGTQAGNTTTNNAGFVVYDSDSTAFKHANGTFVTTEDVLKSGMLFGANLKIGNNVVSARADTALTGYTVVRFTSFGRVAPVNLFNLDQSFFGFVEETAVMGQQVQVILEGVVTNGGWNWSAANAPIYADASGQLTETRPTINDADPVAYAISATQIVLRPSRVEVGLVDHATDTEFGAVRLDAAPVGVAGYLDLVYDPTVGANGLGTGSTGLSVTNTYTAQLVVDGVVVDIVYGPGDFPVGPTVPTVAEMLTFLNTELSGVAVVTLESTTVLRVTSASVGPESAVRLTSGSAVLPNLDLFEEVSNFSFVDEPVDGYWDSVAASAAALGNFVLRAGDTMTGALTVEETIVAEKDNATALRVRGPNHATEGGIDVQSYSGIFYNDGYDVIGTLKTRFITGGNLEMDVVLISPHQLQLVGADATQADGQVWILSKTNVVINARGEPEDPAGAQLIIDRANTGSTGSGNTSNVVLSASVGQIEFGSIPLMPTYTTGSLPTVVPGGVIFVSDANAGDGALAFGNSGGTSWIDPSTVVAVSA